MSAAGTAYDHYDWPVFIELKVLECRLPVAIENFWTNGRSGVHTFAMRIFHGFREGTAFYLCQWRTQLVGQAWRHVGFMNYDGNAIHLCAIDHGYGNESALGKDHIRL